ncbi:BsuPI-related putative proteinase inhibitor [Ferrimonas aestuarii]|uniref:Intracellular proteinase inhibitor BsuPI domain-containing protein n=1 Tax=Ferrimonas aestuarii TaxID=2569539 RepID=A0A4U1BRH9_9GAMM|nr:BsuPI-related putative proteinase inhibitor [Ferrimonas aestuarii]TKB54320.1 hypothetical protein FCL42_13095 [Ferrimonas aestuarii]
MNKFAWVLALALAGCNATSNSASTEPKEAAMPLVSASQSATNQLDLQVAVEANPWDKTQALPVQVWVTNTTSTDLSVTLSSGMTADLVLSQNGKTLWQFSGERMFTQALVAWGVPANDKRTLTFTIPERVITGLKGGEYQLHAVLNTFNHETSAPLTITIQ